MSADIERTDELRRRIESAIQGISSVLTNIRLERQRPVPDKHEDGLVRIESSLIGCLDRAQRLRRALMEDLEQSPPAFSETPRGPAADADGVGPNGSH